jgi:nicotinamide riboside transporter PnuC
MTTRIIVAQLFVVLIIISVENLYSMRQILTTFFVFIFSIVLISSLKNSIKIFFILTVNALFGYISFKNGFYGV